MKRHVLSKSDSDWACWKYSWYYYVARPVVEVMEQRPTV
jgi:hypothetical protein